MTQAVTCIVLAILLAGCASGRSGTRAAMDPDATVAMKFLCEKHIVDGDEPLVTRGILYVAFTSGEPSFRLQTQSPHQSDVVLHEGRILARAQHDDEWSDTRQGDKPGLTAMYNVLAARATGHEEPYRSWFRQSASGTWPSPLPRGIRRDTTTSMVTLDVSDEHLAKSVRQLRFGYVGAAKQLRLFEISTAPGDVVRYWFSEAAPAAGRDIFSPMTTTTKPH